MVMPSASTLRSKRCHRLNKLRRNAAAPHATSSAVVSKRSTEFQIAARIRREADMLCVVRHFLQCAGVVTIARPPGRTSILWIGSLKSKRLLCGRQGRRHSRSAANDQAHYFQAARSCRFFSFVRFSTSSAFATIRKCRIISSPSSRSNPFLSIAICMHSSQESLSSGPT